MTQERILSTIIAVLATYFGVWLCNVFTPQDHWFIVTNITLLWIVICMLWVRCIADWLFD